MLVGVGSLLSKMPDWMGSLPAWATFFVVVGYIVVQWLKNQPALRKQESEERQHDRDTDQDRIKRLETLVEECHAQSRIREAELQEEIDTLKMRLSNEALQRIQSEISLVQTLIQIVPDAAQLKAIIAGLESRQVRMVREEMNRLNVEKEAGDENEGA